MVFCKARHGILGSFQHTKVTRVLREPVPLLAPEIFSRFGFGAGASCHGMRREAHIPPAQMAAVRMAGLIPDQRLIPGHTRRLLSRHASSTQLEWCSVDT
jgi:hypothetical protein